MTLGIECLAIRGTERLLRQGEMILVDPGEAHANRALDDRPFAYAVMYIPVPVMAGLLAEGIQRDFPLPRLCELPVGGGAGAARFLDAHKLMMQGASALDEESALLGFLSSLVFQNEGGNAGCDLAGIVAREPTAVRRARDFLDAHFREPVSLRQLADLAGTSSFHLLRSFTAGVGLPPGSYQTQLRIREAKALLRTGAGIAQTALDLGFADQSHLTRHFQKYVGTSPGRYRAQ